MAQPWDIRPFSFAIPPPPAPPQPPPNVPPEMLLPLLGNRPQPMPLSLGGALADLVNPPTPNALMPQSRFEQTEQDRSNRQAGAVFDAAGTLAPLAIPGGMIARGAGALVRGVGNLMARAPRTVAASTAGGATVLGTGQAETPTETLGTVRTNEEKARAAHAAVLKRREELQAAFDRYDPARITGLSGQERERAVKDLQEELRRSTDERGQPLYRGRIDGNWGGQTTAAAAARREQLRLELETARGAVTEASTALGGLTSRREALDREERVRAAEANLPSWARFVRDYNIPLSLAAGGIAGPLVRWPTRRGVEGLRTRNVTSGNQALAMGAGDEVGRVANLNTFYNRGGGPDPFRVDRNAPLGFTANANQVPASTLYPTGNSWFQGPDYARMTGIGLGTGIAYDRHRAALRELEEARRVVDQARNPTQDQLDRMTRAEAMAAVARLALGTSTTALGSYPTSAAVMRYRSRAAPHTNLAEAEVMRLNNLLAAQPGGRGQPWNRPQATDVTPNIRPDPTSGSGYRRTSGHFASREEIELHRMMEESQRLSRRR